MHGLGTGQAGQLEQEGREQEPEVEAEHAEIERDTKCKVPLLDWKPYFREVDAGWEYDDLCNAVEEAAEQG